MGAVAAAAVLHKEKHIIAAYESAGAMSPDTAKTPAALGVHDGMALRRLRDRAVLREAGNGALYLDAPTWAALRALRRRMAAVILLLALGAAAAMALVYR